MNKEANLTAADTDRPIDLGAAGAETRGSQQPSLPDEVAGQYMQMAGLSED